MLMNFGLIFSYLFSMMNHPLSLGFMLMIQTLWISIFIGYLSKTFWFSYILFITFLGGMLILFIYMTSLSTNIQFKFSFNYLIFMMFLLLISYWLLMKNNSYIFMNWLNNNDSMINHVNLFNNLNTLNMNKLYNLPNNFMTILLIIYLLMTLIIVIKITSLFEGPMRKTS
uniref:NADH dehydrogenase subunit 6 n=1 Tax=Ctenophthalmus quadratus TaxID=3032178 RepID=UPI0023F3E8F2|nr:NADH dehydrogenase subunit 6 [Ctenophthalmus quadratus]WEF75076.1 NADH dehydrogenase subunit 6 [Ctenophthalmus quadratus]